MKYTSSRKNEQQQHTTDAARQYLIESYNRAYAYGGIMLAHLIFEGIHRHYEALGDRPLYLKDTQNQCKVSA